MDDLIRREDVLRIITNGWNNHYSCKDMCDEIKEIPTTYNVDKVVEQIAVDEKEIIRKAMERIIKRFEEEIKQNPEASLREYRAGFYKAIEIATKVGAE